MTAQACIAQYDSARKPVATTVCTPEEPLILRSGLTSTFRRVWAGFSPPQTHGCGNVTAEFANSIQGGYGPEAAIQSFEQKENYKTFTNSACTAPSGRGARRAPITLRKPPPGASVHHGLRFGDFATGMSEISARADVGHWIPASEKGASESSANKNVPATPVNDNVLSMDSNLAEIETPGG